MNNTANIIFAFIGGAAVGALATIGILKKTGKLQADETNDISSNTTGGKLTCKPSSTMPEKDKPSFDVSKKPDAERTQYNGITTKPEFNEFIERYDDLEMTKKKEITLDDAIDEDEESEEDLDDEDRLQREIAEALMEHPGEVYDDTNYEVDGYGHVYRRMDLDRRDLEIYFIPEEYLGEIYPVEELTYYDMDDVLCDQNGVPISDVERVVGYATEAFGDYGGKKDFLHIRNCSIGIEYELKYIHGYFGARVYGISDEEMFKMEQEKARKKKAAKKVSKEDEE